MSVRKDKVQLSVEINGKKAGGSLKQLEASAKLLKRQLRETTDPKKAAEYASQLRKVNGRISSIWKSTRAVNKQSSIWKRTLATLSVAGLVAGVYQGIRAVANLGRESLKLFNEQAKADAQLKAGIKSTNGAAKKSYEELKKEASEFQKVSLFGDEQIQKAQSTLLTFTNIQGEVFTQGTQAVLDYSQKLGVDLQSASIQVGKALNDPIKGVSALGRAGVQFSNDQKAMIKSLQDTGDIAGAQAIVLKELETQFAGSAMAAAEAGLGGYTQLGNDIGDIKEELGEFITKGLLILLPLLRNGLAIIVGFAKGLATVPKFLYENREAIGFVVAGLLLFNTQMIIAGANSIRLAAIEKGRVLVTTAVTTAQNLLNAAMTANPIGLVIKGVGLLVAAFGVLYARSEKVRAGISGLGAVASEIFTIIKEAVSTFIDGFKALKNGDFSSAFSSFKKGLIKSNPIGIALTEGDRLGKAFNRGFQERIASEKDKKAESILDQSDYFEQAGKTVGEKTGESILDGIKSKLENKDASIGIEVRKRSILEAPQAIGRASLSKDEALKNAEQIAQKRFKILKAAASQELQLSERNFLLGLLAEEEYNLIKLEKKEATAQMELEVLEALGLRETEVFRNKELEKLNAQKEINDQLIANEKRTSEIKRMLQQESLDTFRSVVDESIGLLARDEKARKKNASLIKAFETGKIAVNSAVEISEIFKGFAALGPIGQLLAAGKALAAGFRATSAIAKVNSQTFSDGGDTGLGYYTDHTGHKVAGLVHDKEYVIPKWMNTDSRMQPIISSIERIRQRGSFAEGGFTSINTTPSNSILDSIGSNSIQNNKVNQDLIAVLAMAVQAFSQPSMAVVSLTDIEDKSAEINQIRDLASL